MQKKAISVYNPQNTVSKSVQDTYYDIHKEWLTSNAVISFVESMIAYDGLYNQFLENPSYISKVIFNSPKSEIIIPCHVLELRQILRKRKIVSNYKIGAFFKETANRLLSEYPIFLVFDKSQMPRPLHDFKNYFIYDNEVEFDNALIRVMCLEKNLKISQTIDKIVQEEYPSASSHINTQVPGLSITRVAQATIPGKQILERYVVNISAIGISNFIINATSPEKAVLDAILKKKQDVNGNTEKPQYTVDYWKNSPYWPNIVRKASKIQFKLAQNVNDSQINLTPVEQQIFRFLINLNEKYQLGLTYRVAGGWTRDKLLQKESDDIDIALDKMTGAQLGQYIRKEIGKSGNIIKANPEQSKHLETMTINLFGQDIDFVNLRSETYGDSRIPQMEFGTPETDALRRDLTINALFYNINTASVEDFTGSGIKDLGIENGVQVNPIVLRTPLEPNQTFTDDPLRILRMIRFYSKYPGSQIDPEALQAMQNPNVQQALKSKVSPERIYIEWKKMFAGKRPQDAARILYETGLWNTIFQDQIKDLNPFTMDQKNQHHIDNVLEHTLKVIEEYYKILSAEGVGDEERANALAAAFLHDIGKLEPSIIGTKETVDGIFNTYHGHEDVSEVKARSILQALKASNEDIDYVAKIVKNHMIPHQHGENDGITDKRLRKLVRELGRNLVRRIIQHAKADAMSKPGADTMPYDQLLGRAQNIEELPQKSTIIPGQTLMQMFPNLKPSSGFMRVINDRLVEMRDGNPNLTQQDYFNAIESWRNELNQMFQNYVPTPKTQQSMPKKAQTWYESMKQIGEKQGTVTWLCGEVAIDHRYDTPNGKYDYVLKTNEGEYIIRSDEGIGEAYINAWKKYQNKKICCKGIIEKNIIHVSEISLEHNQNDKFKTIKREKPSEMIQYQVGDTVRHRKRGIAFAQITGTVKKIEKGLMYVKWQGVDELEVFNLNDTVALFSKLTKA